MGFSVLPISRSAPPVAPTDPLLQFDPAGINMIDPLFRDVNGEDPNKATSTPVTILGGVPGFANRVVELLPGCNTMRVGISINWFNASNQFPAEIQGIFDQWVAAGKKILWLYANKANDSNVVPDTATIDEKIAGLDTVVQMASDTFTKLGLYLDANPTIKAASVGMELYNEPAVYMHVEEAAIAERHPVYGQAGVVKLIFIDHVLRLIREVNTWWRGWVWVPGYRYQASFEAYLTKDANGVSGFDKVRSAVGTHRLVWAWHAYPNWTLPKPDALAVQGSWRNVLSFVGSDRASLTETNNGGTGIYHSDFSDYEIHHIIESYPYLRDRGISTGHFPPFNTGSSSLAVFNTTSQEASLQHPYAYSEVLHLWATGGNVPRGTFIVPAEVRTDYRDLAGLPRGTALAPSARVVYCGDSGEMQVAVAGHVNMIYGGRGDDNLSGMAGGRSLLYGIRGNNVLTARGTVDVVRGGTGVDTIFADGDMAYIHAGFGSSNITVRSGAAYILTGSGTATTVTLHETGGGHVIIHHKASDRFDVTNWTAAPVFTQEAEHVRMSGGAESVVFQNTTVAVIRQQVISGPPSFGAVLKASSAPETFAGAASLGSISTTVPAKLWLGDYDGTSLSVTAVGVSGTSVEFQAEPVSGSITVVTSTSYPIDPDHGFARGRIVGLLPDVEYDVRAIVDGFPGDTVGKFRTRPDSRRAFKIGFASCGERTRNHPIYETITAQNPDMVAFYHMGDRGYFDITTNDVSLFHLYDDVIFGQSRQAAFHSQVPVIYMWDDHDYGGNGSNAASASRPAAMSWFRSRVPARPVLTGTETAVYRAHGPMPGVTVALLDTRSDRSGTTFLSTDQESWLIALIQNLPDTEVLIISAGTPWISSSDTDTWYGAASQRTRIGAAILEHAAGRVAVIAGDAHMLAYDDGRNAVGNVPVFQAAPLGRANSSKGGPYSGGVVQATEQQYGVLEFEPMIDGWQVTFRGYSVDDAGVQTQRLSHMAQLVPASVAPVILFSDSFDTDGSLGGLNWDMVQGAGDPLVVAAGTLTVSNINVTRSAVVATYDDTYADQFAEVQVVTHGSNAANIQPCVRMHPTDSSGTWYGLAMNGGTASWTLRKRVSGTTTTLATYPVSNKVYPITGRIEVRGNEIICYKDGVEIGRITDNDIATGHPGILMYRAPGDTASTVAADNFSGGMLAAMEFVQFSVSPATDIYDDAPVGTEVVAYTTNADSVAISGTDAGLLAIQNSAVVTAASLIGQTNLDFTLTASASGKQPTTYTASIAVTPGASSDVVLNFTSNDHLFQDTAATIPVTAVGQNVRRIKKPGFDAVWVSGDAVWGDAGLTVSNGARFDLSAQIEVAGAVVAATPSAGDTSDNHGVIGGPTQYLTVGDGNYRWRDAVDTVTHPVPADSGMQVGSFEWDGDSTRVWYDGVEQGDLAKAKLTEITRLFHRSSTVSYSGTVSYLALTKVMAHGDVARKDHQARAAETFWPLLTEEVLITADGVPFTFEVKGTNDPAKPFLVSHHGVGTMTSGDFYNAGTVTARLGIKSFSPWFNSPRFTSDEYQRGGYPSGKRTAKLEAHILDAVRAYQGEPSQPAVVFGHSAGGQWTSRVAAYDPPSNVARYVVANPSTYVFPDGRDAPYGFGALGYTTTQLDDAAKAYLQLPITIYHGENDTLIDSDLGDPDNLLGQGVNRRDRAENVYAAAVVAASTYGVPLGWEKIVAPGLGHDGTGMLNATAFDIAAFPPAGDHAVRLAVNAGVGAGLKFAIDPASSLSYPGSDQHVFDFMRYLKMNLGTSATAGEATEPAFVGTPNGLSAATHFTLDGADYLTLDGANPPWVDNLHKSGTKLTIAAMAYLGTHGGASYHFSGTQGPGTDKVGFFFGLNANNQLAFNVRAGASAAYIGFSTTVLGSSGEWALYMVSFEGGVSSRLSKRTAAGYSTSSLSATFTSTPSTLAASQPLQVAASGAGAFPLMAGSRLGPVWMWEGVALTDAQLQAFSAVVMADRA